VNTRVALNSGSTRRGGKFSSRVLRRRGKQRVWDLADERNVSLRTGALVAGIREVASALEARGIFP
jgi:hypothetical protein